MVVHVETELGAGTQVQLPLTFMSDSVFVDWGDSTIDTLLTGGLISHTYTVEGSYDIEIEGGLTQYGTAAINSDVDKIVGVSSFGDLPLVSLAYAFYQHTNLDSVPVNLPSSVTDLQSTFEEMTADSLKNLELWQTGNVTNMNSTFLKAASFNQALSNWDVRKVRTFDGMFDQATQFNSSLSGWVLDSAFSTVNMFRLATSFNQELDSWQIYRVNDMTRMFQDASSFNQDLNSWSTDSVVDMEAMFELASNFNGGISSWNTSEVVTMNYMFQGASNFNQPIGSWNTASLENIASMFQRANSFTGDISTWNTSNLRYMEYAFSWNDVFNSDISAWDVSRVQDMRYTFAYSPEFNQDLSAWDVDSVLDFTATFDYAESFESDLSGWDVSRATGMSQMFRGCQNFDSDLNQWDVSQVTNMQSMFDDTGVFSASIKNWDISKVSNMDYFLTNTEVDSLTYDSILTNWSKLNLESDVTLYIERGRYTQSGKIATDSLIQNFNWTIVDGGLTTPVAPFVDNPIADTILSEDFLEIQIANQTVVFDDENQDDLIYDARVLNGVVDFYLSGRRNTIVNLKSRRNLNGVDTLILSASDSTSIVYDTIVITVTPVVDDPSLTKAYTQHIPKNDSLTLIASMTDGDADFQGYELFAENGLNYSLNGNTVIPEQDFLGELIVPVKIYNGVDTLGPVDMKILVTEPITLTYDTDFSPGTRVNLALFDTVQAMVDWGDGHITLVDTVWDEDSDDYTSHTYNTGGEYQVRIYGEVGQLGYYSGRNNDKLKSVDGFGTVYIHSLSGLLAYAHNVEEVIDTIPSTVTSLSSLFEGAEYVRVEGVQYWNTINIENMEYLAYDAENFNQDISSWNTSNVTTFYEAFYEAYAFDQPIGSWTMSSVTTMEEMFYGAHAFNQDISSWDVSSVEVFDYAFSETYQFNQDLSDWQTTSAITMGEMFYEATAFNGDISNWNVSSVEEFDYMFEDATSFNQDISSWDVTGAESMRGMFDGALVFNQDLSSWAVDSVADFRYFMRNVPLYTSYYDSLLVSFSQKVVADSLTLDMGDIRYSVDGSAARDYLINTKKWTINDGGSAGFERIKRLENITLSEDFGTTSYVDLDDHYKAYTGGNIDFELTFQGSIYSAEVSAEGLVTLNSVDNLNGIDTLIVQATHALGVYHDTVVVTINPVNDVPVIVSTNSLSVNEDDTLTISLTDVTYTDVESDFVNVLIESHLNYTVIGSQVIPEANYFGELKVPIRIFDADTSLTDTILVNVTSVNDVPIINSIDTSEALSGEVVELTLSMIEEFDVEGDLLEVILIPGSGYVVDSTSIVIDANYIGELNVGVKLWDGSDSSSLSEWIIDVDETPSQILVTQLRPQWSILNQSLVMENLTHRSSQWIIQIVNLNGEVIRSMESNVLAGSSQIVPLNSLSVGIYIIHTQELGYEISNQSNVLRFEKF